MDVHLRERRGGADGADLLDPYGDPPDQGRGPPGSRQACVPETLPEASDECLAEPPEAEEAGRPEAEEAGRAEAGRPEAGRPEAGRPEAKEAGRPEVGRAEAGRPEAGRPEAAQQQQQQEEEEEKEEGELWLRLLRDRRWRGLSLAGAGTRFGSCAKVASVPLIAASVLPGGATAAGSLLAAAGLSGLAGAPLGGLLSDRVGARTTAVLSGGLSATALLLVPLALTAPLGDDPLANGLAFGALILLWSVGVAAQGPALTAVAQELAPKGSEATALALPKAVGDAVYIVAPFLLGVITDKETVVGTECAAAGALSLLGVVALQVLGGDGSEDEGGDARGEV